MALADFLTDDLAVFFDDPFGVSATSGATTAKVLLDQPSQVLAGDMVLPSFSMVLSPIIRIRNDSGNIIMRFNRKSILLNPP